MVVALSEVRVDIVAPHEEARFRELMQTHHYLGALPGIGETVRYVAHHRGQWLALVVFSAPALKCAARDRWIGWDYAVQFDRLHLLTNNSRFLLLPGAARNLGSRVLSLCTRRLVRDWPVRFGHLIAHALDRDGGVGAAQGALDGDAEGGFEVGRFGAGPGGVGAVEQAAHRSGPDLAMLAAVVLVLDPGDGGIVEPFEGQRFEAFEHGHEAALDRGPQDLHLAVIVSRRMQIAVLRRYSRLMLWRYRR